MLRLLSTAFDFIYRIFIRPEPPLRDPPPFVHYNADKRPDGWIPPLEDWTLEDMKNLHEARRAYAHWNPDDEKDDSKRAATYDPRWTRWSGVLCETCGNKKMICEDAVLQRKHCIATWFEPIKRIGKV